MLYATHVVSDVELTADQILLLREGRLIQKSGLQELQDQMTGRVFEAAVSAEQLGQIYHISQIYRQPGQLVTIRMAAEQFPKGIAAKEVIPSLDDIYIYFCVMKKENRR